MRNSADRAVVPGLCDTCQGEHRVYGGVAAQTFYHATWLVLSIVHGHEFIAGETQSLDMLDEALEQFFVLKKMPTTGFPEIGGTSDRQFTKRTVSWSADRCHWKADNSHGEKQEMQLMRLASCISAVPQFRWDFQCQEMPDEVCFEVDSDWAQCSRTRRSTGGGLV